jgi:hypothetical protein
MRTAVFFLACLVASTVSAQGDHVYTVSTTDGMIRRINPLTGTTLSSVQMITTAPATVTGCNGLVRHPASGQLYAIVRDVSATSVRKLATVNPTTGSVTVIGALSDNLANLAFRADGVLFGVTGDGATVPETLYTIDVNSAAATFVMALGNGSDGEALAFGADGFLYHASGLGVPNVHEVFERIDTSSNVITPITLSGFDTDEVLSLTLWVGGNFLVADRFDRLIVTNSSGVVRLVANFDHSYVKGIAFVPSPNSQAFFHPYGGGCATAAGPIPLLAGTGTPSPGMSVQLNLLLAPVNSAGYLGIGTGNQSFPIPSATCQVQILPVASDLVPFTTSATGTWVTSAQIPPGLPPDLFVQVALVDGVNLVVSNPVRIHIL